MRELGDLADDLDAGRPGTDHDERQIGLALALVGCHIRHFERTQNVIPQVASVLQRLHSRRELRPLVVPEIRMGCAGSHYQAVVRQRDPCTVRRDRADGSRRQIDVHDFAENNVGVLLLVHNASQRGRDQALGQDAGGDLIEQRLEEMMVRPVDQRHVDVGLRQNSADVDATETSADHNDFGAVSGSPAVHVGHAQELLQSIFDSTEVCL